MYEIQYTFIVIKKKINVILKIKKMYCILNNNTRVTHFYKKKIMNLKIDYSCINIIFIIKYT